MARILTLRKARLDVGGSSSPIRAHEDTRRAVDELRKACPEKPPEVIVGLREWGRISENMFALRDREEPYWVRCIQQLVRARVTKICRWVDWQRPSCMAERL